MIHSRWIVWGLALGALGFGRPAWADDLKYRGSASELQARKTGRSVLRELTTDLNRDGQPEIAIVESLKGRLRVVVLRPEDPDDGVFVRVAQGTAQRASKVARFEARSLVGSRAPELFAVFEDPSPDDVRMSVRIMGAVRGEIRELFEHTFLLPKKRGPDPTGVVAWGDATPHYLLDDLEEDGDREVVWVKAPRTLELIGRDGPVLFHYGALRTVYRYDPEVAKYRVDEGASTVDFVPPHTPTAVEATAQSPKIWGTAQAFWGADRDLETSWNIPLARATTQSITLRYPRAKTVLIRLVPGCAGSESAWRQHHQIRKFRVVLSSGVRFEVDRARLDRIPDAVEAMDEFSLTDDYGAQLLIALRTAQNVSWARLEVLAVEKSDAASGTRIDEVCMSEISLH